MTIDQDAANAVTPYERFGGEAFFHGLVAAFYSRVADDPILRPMYPADDLHDAERRLRLFLMQYWGGPHTYDDERGHPRLRMRHAGFAIDSTARDRWLNLMHDALVEQAIEPAAETELWTYLVGAAFAMQNVPDDAPPANAMEATEVPK